MKSGLRPALLAAAALIALPSMACAVVQNGTIPPVSGMIDGTGYADLTDLVIAAPVIADATIRSAIRLKGDDATGVAPGLTRYYVEADVGALVRGAGGLPPRIGYLVDVAPDATGRQPRLKKQRVLLFGRPVAGMANQIQLVAPDAQIAWSPADDQRIRTIAQALVAPDAPPIITGIGNAFHVPGALPGEGETQVFLQTADARPVSLSILRRPGEQPRWSVSLGEIVEEGGGPPPRDTLLWYRLACALPRSLPDTAIDQLSPDDAARAREDYDVVLTALGACGRTSA